MTSPDYAARARSAKAAKIRDFILDELLPRERRSPNLPGLVAGFTPASRLAVAKEAGAHAPSRPDDLPPSDETWELVVEGIRRFVADARLEDEVEAAMAGSPA